MHAIIQIHTGTPTQEDISDLCLSALTRLAAYVDDEGPTLARVLRLVGATDGCAALDALRTLHCDAGDEMDALADAERHLEGLLETLAELPVRAQAESLVVPREDWKLLRDIDMAVRWLGARTQDMLGLARYVRRRAEAAHVRSEHSTVLESRR